MAMAFDVAKALNESHRTMDEDVFDEDPLDDDESVFDTIGIVKKEKTRKRKASVKVNWNTH